MLKFEKISISSESELEKIALLQKRRA